MRPLTSRLNGLISPMSSPSICAVRKASKPQKVSHKKDERIKKKFLFRFRRYESEFRTRAHVLLSFLFLAIFVSFSCNSCLFCQHMLLPISQNASFAPQIFFNSSAARLTQVCSLRFLLFYFFLSLNHLLARPLLLLSIR